MSKNTGQGVKLTKTTVLKLGDSLPTKTSTKLEIEALPLPCTAQELYKHYAAKGVICFTSKIRYFVANDYLQAA